MGIYWWALGLWGWQPVLRLILVGVQPCSQGDRCGPSGGGFNHNSPHLHTHTHTLQQHRTRSVSHLRFFNCRCSLYEHFMYNIYFLSFLQSSFCRNESPFLLETLRCLKPHQKPYAIRSAKFTPLWLLIRNNLSEIRHIHGPSLSWPSALCTKTCPRRTNPALQMSLHA